MAPLTSLTPLASPAFPRGRRAALLDVAPPLLVFAVATWQVAARGPASAADERLARAVRAHPPATWLAQLCADLGDLALALPVLAAAAGYVWWRGRRAWPALLWTGAAAAVMPALVSLLKACLDRPGPLGGSGYYPSGHAATAAIAYGGAAVLLRSSTGVRDRWPSARWRWPRRWQEPRRCQGRWRWLPAYVAAVLCLLNGAGLVWRGYHWPLDVLASWCLAWAPLAAGRRAAAARRFTAAPERRRRPGARRPRAAPTPARPEASAAPNRPAQSPSTCPPSPDPDTE